MKKLFIKNKTISILVILSAVAVIVFAAAYMSMYGGENVKLPVLVYHSVAEESDNPYTVSEKSFKQQLYMLKKQGYSSVTLQNIEDFVEEGRPLPKKPILLTFDDGYVNNLTVAAPILEETGFNAVIFSVGRFTGAENNPHTGEKLSEPYFDFVDAKMWAEKGVIDIQSHTFDMHQLKSYDTTKRDGLLALEDESEDEHLTAIKSDCEAFRTVRNDVIDTQLLALAYPYGYYTDKIDEYLETEGIRITFTTEEFVNVLKIGDADSLRKMGRINVVDDTSGFILVLRLLKNRIFT